MKGLILHCGGAEATIEQVKGVRTPPHTDTWYPIDHHHLLDLTRKTIETTGLRITEEAHGLQGEGGENYYGLLRVEKEGEDTSVMSTLIGLRNSNSKKYAAGILRGDNVVVCDNAMFTGEFEIGRKHTKNIMNELPSRLLDIIEGINNQWNYEKVRWDAYALKELTNKDAHDIIIKGYDSECISGAGIKHVLKQWREPEHDEFSGRDAWSLYNGFTYALKGTPNLLFDRTKRLTTLFDNICETQINSLRGQESLGLNDNHNEEEVDFHIN